jgi:hypothetical protein
MRPTKGLGLTTSRQALDRDSILYHLMMYHGYSILFQACI